MASREVEEVNASSMADIAFLLLVFFIVANTFSKEMVIEEKMPQKNDNAEKIKVKPWNVLEIFANKNDQILVEEEFYLQEVSEITEYVLDFYEHPKNLDNVKWPEVITITEKMAKDSMGFYQKGAQTAENSDTQDAYLKTADKWEKKYEATKLLGGSYPEISNKAVVAIKLDNSTTFGTYIEIVDAIMVGVNQLRNDMCQKYYNGRTYTSLDEDIEDEKAMKEALELAYPKRIMKLKGVASAE